MSVRPGGRWRRQLLGLSDAALVGTTVREDGSTQLTYHGWPLYYVSGDESAGDTAGQGINDVWFVVGPDGEQIESEAGDTDASGPDC